VGIRRAWIRISVPSRINKGTLKAPRGLDGVVRIVAEILPSRKEETVELGADSTGLDLLRALRLAPDAYVLIRGDLPMPADGALVDAERIRVVRIVSGGA
jgi:sulfur carrier protein ThiS